MISSLLFAVCILSLLQSWLLKRDFFAPLNIYLFSQSLSLGIAYTKLMPEMTDFHLKTWLVVIGAAVSFALGVFSMRLVWAARHPSAAIATDAPRRSLLSENNRNYRWWLHTFVTLLAFAYLLVGLAAEYRALGTLALFSKNITKLMTIGGMPNLGILVYPLSSGPLVAMLAAPGCFRSLNPHRGRRLFFRSIWIVALFLGFSGVPNRISVFSAALVLLYTFNLAAFRIRPAVVVVGVALSLLAFMAVAESKGQSTGVRQTLLQKEVLKLPYSYIANNWWNLDYALNKHADQPEHPRLYGLDLLHGVMMPNPFFGRLYSSYKWDGIFNESTAKVYRLNSISYHWSLYKDFGMAGAVGLPFLFGFFFNFLYITIRTRGTISHLMLYTYFMFWTTLWFFEEFWSNGLYISWLVVLGMTGWLASRPPSDLSLKGGGAKITRGESAV